MRNVDPYDVSAHDGSRPQRNLYNTTSSLGEPRAQRDYYDAPPRGGSRPQRNPRNTTSSLGEPRPQRGYYDAPAYDDPRSQRNLFDSPSYDEPKPQRASYDAPAYGGSRPSRSSYDAPAYSESRSQRSPYDEPPYDEPRHQRSSYDAPLYDEPRHQRNPYDTSSYGDTRSQRSAYDAPPYGEQRSRRNSYDAPHRNEPPSSRGNTTGSLRDYPPHRNRAPLEDDSEYYSRRSRDRYDDDDIDDDDDSYPKSFRSQNKKLNISIAVLSSVLVVAILVCAILPGQLRLDSSPSLSGPSLGSGGNGALNSQPEQQLDGTILPATADAGPEYIGETLFIGDSNTMRLRTDNAITDVSLSNCIGIEGMGIQSVVSHQAVKFNGYSNLLTIPAAVELMQPRRIVMCFGTNNVGGISEENFISSYRSALDAINEAYPYADIIIAAIPPVSSQPASALITQAEVDSFNVALAVLAKDRGDKFLNWAEALKEEAPSSNGIKYALSGYVEGDGIHLTASALAALITYTRTHSYETEDDRPQPLNPIPVQVSVPSTLIPSSVPSQPESSASSRPTSSSSSSSSSTNSSDVSVLLQCGEGGAIEVNGSRYGSIALEIPPGSTIPNARAVPADGYEFYAWSCSVGSISDPSNPLLSGFVVFMPEGGNRITITANFRPVSTPTPPPTPPPTPEPPVPSSTPEPTPPSAEEKKPLLIS